jgi:Domain of unknown function (DUF4249)
MKMKQRNLFFIGILLGISSCISEIKDFVPVDSNSFLIVQATLSNQNGPHRVVLSYSSPNIKINVEDTPIKNAVVFIKDDKNQTESLTEISDGIYETSSAYKGIIGNTYTLNINLPNGKKYRSSPEKLYGATLIDKISSNFSVKTNYPSTDVRSVGFDVTLDFNDSSEPNQYYQWTWTHFERIVYCATCTLGYDFGLQECSKVPNFSFGQRVPEIINFRCGTNCFDITSNSTYNILSDNLLNGQKITNFPIMRVPYSDRSLYYLRIQQRTISPKAYQYFRSIKEVAQNSGTLFDTPAITQFSPNIFNLDDTSERILGLFEVFGSDERIVLIDRKIGTDNYYPVVPPSLAGRELYGGLTAPTGPRAACIEGKYRTKRIPKDWKD